MTSYADYLLRAGATVVPMRPVGRQINEVVLDNDSAGVTFSGSWSNSSQHRVLRRRLRRGCRCGSLQLSPARSTGHRNGHRHLYAEHSAGRVSIRCTRGCCMAPIARCRLYEINHTGGTTEISVDHSKVGYGWVYLGTYHFDAGSSATPARCRSATRLAVAGKVVIADAIRFGNGMGDFVGVRGARHFGLSARRREFVSLDRPHVGVGTTLATAIGVGDHAMCRRRRTWRNTCSTAAFGEAVYVGFHSNAGGGRGARSD